MKYHIKDPKLAAEGAKRIEWAESKMPVLRLIRKRFLKTRPLKGVRISCCLHITTETANLLVTLKAGGASVMACASNPLSTQDDVAACLVKNHHIPTFAVKGDSHTAYYRNIQGVMMQQPNILIDDGADLISTTHKRGKIKDVFGGTEETTTGVVRLKSMERHRALLFPIIAVNDSDTKHLFDNRYGTGQSTMDGVLRATNILVAGMTVVVVGYGWCGRGVAMRAEGMGARVIVCEVDPVKALEAQMDGHMVMKADQAARLGDLFITVTGDINVLTRRHFVLMKDGAIMANSGHFDVEIDQVGLSRVTKRKRTIRRFCDEYLLRNGRRIYLLTEGRLVNLSAAEGHPAMVMDMSFANQALAAEFLVNRHRRLGKKVHRLPKEIDDEIAFLKLESMGIKIDKLTKEQQEYLASWKLGT